MFGSQLAFLSAFSCNVPISPRCHIRLPYRTSGSHRAADRGSKFRPALGRSNGTTRRTAIRLRERRRASEFHSLHRLHHTWARREIARRGGGDGAAFPRRSRGESGPRESPVDDRQQISQLGKLSQRKRPPSDRANGRTAQLIDKWQAANSHHRSGRRDTVMFCLRWHGATRGCTRVVCTRSGSRQKQEQLTG